MRAVVVWSSSRYVFDPEPLVAHLRSITPTVQMVTARRRRRLHASSAEPSVLRQPANLHWPLRLGEQLYITAPDDLLQHAYTDAEIEESHRRWMLRERIARECREDAMAWWATLGPSVQADVVAMLRAEQLALPDATEPELAPIAYAVYIDVAINRPQALADFFPLLAASGSAGPEPTVAVRELSAAHGLPVAPSVPVVETLPSTRSGEPTEAADWAQRGNFVRAAILYFRRSDDRELAERTVQQGIIEPLARSLGWSSSVQAAWQRGANALLAYTGEDGWPRAAKALYELQKLALDLHQPVYRVAVVEWIRSLGRVPLRQSLDSVRDVLLIRSLHKFRKHVYGVPLASDAFAEFVAVIDEQIQTTLHRIHHQLTHPLRQALDEVGLAPVNRVEAAARDKLIAELIDQLGTKGFLRFADLRDAVARNQLKLADVAGPRELLRGDALLRADHTIATRLPGVYFPGEIYLRLIQRFSGLAFGTAIGRFLTLYLALPFGGAFLILEFLQHAIDGLAGVAASVGLASEAGSWVNLVEPGFILALGLVIGLMLHVPAARRTVRVGWSRLSDALAWVVIRVPRWLANRPWIRAILDHRITRFLERSLVWPMSVSCLVILGALLYNAPPQWAAIAGGIAFAMMNVIVHTSWGESLLDHIAEATADTGRFVQASLLPGIVSWMVWLFRELISLMESVLYSVDEKLRFRHGQPRELIGLKAVLALLWFPIAYVFRFVFYLLVEPQVNPVKHFPVVTVSHKVLLPMAPQLAGQVGVATSTMVTIVSLIPGIFGFLVWELKENWKLYAANRSRTLEPQAIGHHGETVRGLLQPGFHSGTVPKLYRRLRAASERHHGEVRRIATLRDELHHIQEAVAAMVQRNILVLLNQSIGFAHRPITISSTCIGIERIEVDLIYVDLIPSDAPPLRLTWRLDKGAIHASISSEGWLSATPSELQRQVTVALTGLAALASDTRSTPSWADWVALWDHASVPAADGSLQCTTPSDC